MEGKLILVTEEQLDWLLDAIKLLIDHKKFRVAMDSETAHFIEREGLELEKIEIRKMEFFQTYLHYKKVEIQNGKEDK